MASMSPRGWLPGITAQRLHILRNLQGVLLRSPDSGIALLLRSVHGAEVLCQTVVDA